MACRLTSRPTVVLRTDEWNVRQDGRMAEGGLRKQWIMPTRLLWCLDVRTEDPMGRPSLLMGRLIFSGSADAELTLSIVE